PNKGKARQREETAEERKARKAAVKEEKRVFLPFLAFLSSFPFPFHSSFLSPLIPSLLFPLPFPSILLSSLSHFVPPFPLLYFLFAPLPCLQLPSFQSGEEKRKKKTDRFSARRNCD